MKKKKFTLIPLMKNYLLSFFIMWLVSSAIGSNIIGYFDIFLPYIIGSSLLYMLHLVLYRYLSFKHNRIVKNILLFILPLVVILSMYILTIATLKPTLEKFSIIKTSRLPCGEKTKHPKPYINYFFSGRHTSKFRLKKGNYINDWYPNEENYYKYKQGDIIKVKVKKNFLGMEIIVQQHRDTI